MKKIEELDLEEKKVILRCDLNVTIKDSKIVSDEKIQKSLPTIKYLLEKKAKVIIMSHLGKVKTKEDCRKNSLFMVYQTLCTYLNTNVYFSSATCGDILENKIANLKPGEVLLMENTRFEDVLDKKESECNLELAKYWASLGDYFINDAFGLSHRKHASNYGISKFLPTALGLLMEEEIKNLDSLLHPKRPYVVIMGGAKIEDKLDIIAGILPKCDYLLTGGGIANSFLGCYYNIGASITNPLKYPELKKIYDKYKEKIILPIDVSVLNKEIANSKSINNVSTEEMIYDIGPETIELYKKYINNAQTIFLNGTIGKYEDERFADGTYQILKEVSNSSAISIIGGGDAGTSAKVLNIDGFTYISTGGGATLKYIASEKLSCLE